MAPDGRKRRRSFQGYCDLVAEHFSADPSDPSAEPGQALSRQAFLQALARRRVANGDTFKRLELRSGVPKSTLSDMLTRHRVPRREVVEQVIRVYAASEAEATAWTSVWSTLSVQEAMHAPDIQPSGPTTPTQPPPDTTRSPAKRRTPRWSGWLVAGLTTTGIISLLVWVASPVPTTQGTESTSSDSPAAPASKPSAVSVRVYNVQADCRAPRTETCALALSHDPRAPRSGANWAGQVWHGDQLLAECVIDDGRRVTDEKLRSSRSWYLVHVPATSERAWLPGIRVRTREHIRRC